MTKREERIEILGFDDTWLVIIGVPVLATIIDFIFNNSFGRLPIGYAMINWGVSAFFSLVNWMAIMAIMIFFRRIFPDIKEGITRITIVLAVCMISIIGVNELGNHFLNTVLGPDFNGIQNMRMLVPIMLITAMMIAIYEAMYFYVRLKQSIREEEQAKQAVVQAQLDALRNQSQPHFLFNSFNTLRDIIDQESKDDAKQFVDKLSNVYRFILESGNENLIPLNKEIAFAQAYIYIQKERFGENLKVNWNTDSGTENNLIAPMSLQLLLENAIKHNIVSKTKPLEINISTSNNTLIVKNLIQPKSTKLPSTKLGLINIEKRYNLLSDRSIKINNDGRSFEVILPLLKSSEQKTEHVYTDH